MKVNFAEFKTDSVIEDKVFYTLSGMENTTDEKGYPLLAAECDTTYAKKVKNKRGKAINSDVSYTYYIRLYGNKQLYNPLERYTIEKPNNASYIDKVCKNTNLFIEVNKSIFDMYLEFLKTKRPSWLESAQRALA